MPICPEMERFRAYRTELDPNTHQRAVLTKHAGAARWAYNWGLTQKLQAIGAGEPPPDAMALHRDLNARKRIDLGWLYEVSKCAPQEALRDLDNAFRRQTRSARGTSRPRYKSKKHSLGAFRVTESIKIAPGSVRLPRVGRIRLKEQHYLPVGPAHVLSATVRESGGRWFISVHVSEIVLAETPAGPPVGVDLGIRQWVTTSDGQVWHKPDISRLENRVNRLRRRLTRQQAGGTNYARTARRLARTSARIRNRRLDAMHKITTALTRTKSTIVIENLNASGMLRQRRLARAIGIASFGLMRRQLTYKARWRGVHLIVADRFYPSSKRCSRCAAVVAMLPLGATRFACGVCGLDIDRDLNAALNLLAVAESLSDTKNDCGEAVSPTSRRASMKQEPDPEPCVLELEDGSRCSESLVALSGSDLREEVEVLLHDERPGVGTPHEGSAAPAERVTQQRAF
jgi:putative transposase